MSQPPHSPERPAPYYQAALAFIFLISAAAAVTFLRGDFIGTNDGIGSDGEVYFRMVRDAPEMLDSRLPKWLLTKTLVPVLIRYGLDAFSLELSDVNIWRAFFTLNSIFLGLSAVAWAGVCRKAELSVGGTLFSFSALYLNFGFLKFYHYYPTTLDPPSFLIGVLMLRAYLGSNLLALLALTLAGSFVRQTFLFIGPALLLLGRDTPYVIKESAGELFSRGFLSKWPIFLGAGVLLFGFAYRWWYWEAMKVVGETYTGQELFMAILDKLEHSPHITIPLTLVFVFIALWTLFRNVDTAAVLRNLKARNILLAIGVFVFVKMLLAAFADPAPPMDWSPIDQLLRVSFLSVRKPFRFIVTHIYFFGPVILFSVVLWKDICAHVRSHGTGAVFVVALAVVHGIYPESRQLIELFPFLVFFTALAIDPYLKAPINLRSADAAMLFLLGLFALYVSKVWDKINVNNDAYWYSGVGGRIEGEIYYNHRWWVLAGLALAFWLVRSFRNNARTGETNGS